MDFDTDEMIPEYRDGCQFERKTGGFPGFLSD
jgi:hypothetical protein